jgi:hypothetical protein
MVMGSDGGCCPLHDFLEGLDSLRVGIVCVRGVK